MTRAPKGWPKLIPFYEEDCAPPRYAWAIPDPEKPGYLREIAFEEGAQSVLS